MMGRRKGEQGQLFYAFDPELVVPEDHQSGGSLSCSIFAGCGPSLHRITRTPGGLRSIRS